MSIGLNSTLQPISLSAEGGLLNRKEFQLVDYRFSKWECPSIGGHLVHQPVETPSLSTGELFVFSVDSDLLSSKSFCSSSDYSFLLSFDIQLLEEGNYNSLSYAGTGALTKRDAM